jgi:hypothetical protein
MKHRCSRSVTHESGHFHEILRPDHPLPYRRYRKDINRKQFGVHRTVRARQLRASQQECCIDRAARRKKDGARELEIAIVEGQE